MKRMRPFIVTSWGCSEFLDDPDVKLATEKIEKNEGGALGWSNTYVLVLNPKGELVHHFDAAQKGVTGRRDPDARPNYFAEEIAGGWGKLKLAPADFPSKRETLTLPDVKGGIRIFSRSAADGMGNILTVRTAPMSAEQRKSLSYPTEARTIEAETLRDWLELLQLPRVREADANTPFKSIAGSLTLQAAGADAQGRYATWTGSIVLAKGDGGSDAEVTLKAVATYRPEAPEVHAVRGVIEGNYRYRMRGREKSVLKVGGVLESRPD